MAKHTEVRLVDDLDGGPADETVPFGIDGKPLEVDLSSANAKQLREILAPYVDVARRASRRSPAGTPRPAQDRAANQATREWCRQNGIAIAERGRIPAVAQLAYEQGRPELARG